MRVSGVMSTKVISVSPETPIADAIATLSRHRISRMPVIDGHSDLVGMLSEADCLHRAEIESVRQRSRWYNAVFGPRETANACVRSHGRRVLAEAAKNKDQAGYSQAFDELTDGSISCHAAAQIGFVRIQSPRSLPFDDQSYGR